VAQISRKGGRKISQLILRWENGSNFVLTAPPALRLGSPSFSMSVMIWAKGKIPISTGRKGKRGPADSGGGAVVGAGGPEGGQNHPFASEASVRPATIAIASTNSEKY